MESRHDSIYARHPLLLQVQKEPNVSEANDSGACERSGVLGRRLDPSEVHDLRPEDKYHFTLILPSKQIPFTLSYFLESLEPTNYRGEIKHLEVKIERGEYKERDGLPAVGKRLCTKNLIFNKMRVFRENESFKRDLRIQRGQILVSLQTKHTMQENKTTYIHAKLSNLLGKCKPFNIL